MTTKFVGMKQFRQSFASYAKDAKIKHIRFIILKKNVPVLEVKSLDDKEFTLEKLIGDIKKAREDIKKGNVYTQKQIMAEFGLL